MSQLPWACNPLLTELDLAHRRYAGDLYLWASPEFGTKLPCRWVLEYKALFLRSDQKGGPTFACYVVQRQDMPFRRAVYRKPMAKTLEQREAVYLPTTLGVAFLMHGLAVPMGL